MRIRAALRGADSSLSLNEGQREFASVARPRSGWAGGVDRSACLSSMLNSYVPAVFKEPRVERVGDSDGPKEGPEEEAWPPRPSFSTSFPGTEENRAAVFTPVQPFTSQTPAEP